MATSQPLGLLLQYGCRSVASLILALVISWKLSLVTLAGIPIFSSIIAYLSTKIKPSLTAQQAELTHVSKIANNAIASIDTVKCLNGQTFELRNFASRIEQSAIHYLRQARLNSTQIALIRWMMFGMFVQGFWYGSYLARTENLSSGDVITTFWACTTAAQSIEQVLPQVIVMEKGKLASVILKRMMGERAKDAIGSEVNGKVFPKLCVGDIEVNNVSISKGGMRCKQDSHLSALPSNIYAGVVFISIATRNLCFKPVNILLPGWRDNVCHRKKWLREKHPQPIANEILSANLWRYPDRWACN